MKLQRVRDLCFSRITCVPTAVSESSQRGETAIYHLHLGEIILLFMHSLFLSVHIYPPLSFLYVCPPPFTHTYRSPWRWKVKGGAELCFMKMQTKRSWRLPIFSPSLPHLSPFHSIFYISSSLCLHNFKSPRCRIWHHHWAPFRSSLLCLSLHLILRLLR